MLTRDERVELLKKAREAKAVKKAERDKNKVEPVKGRPKKTDERTLDIVDDVLDEIPTEPIKPKPKPVIPDDVEVVEKEITEKVKKPKRRILRRIIKQEYESDDTEEEYEEIVVKPKRQPRSIPKPAIQQHEVKEQAEKQATLKHLSNPFFNY